MAPKTPDHSALLLAIGVALHQWSHTEQALAELFATCVTGIDRRPALRSFWSLHAFDSKLRITQEAASFFFRKNRPLLARWKNIHNRLTTHKEGRNNIAHGTIVQRHTQGFGATSITTHEPVLQPSYGTILHGSARRDKKWKETDFRDPNDALTLAALRQCIEAFTRDAELIEQLDKDARAAMTPAGHA